MPAWNRCSLNGSYSYFKRKKSSSLTITKLHSKISVNFPISQSSLYHIMQKVTLEDWLQYSLKHFYESHCFIAFGEHNKLIHVTYINHREIPGPTIRFCKPDLCPGSELLFLYLFLFFYFQQQPLKFAWFPGLFFTKEWNVPPLASD